MLLNPWGLENDAVEARRLRDEAKAYFADLDKVVEDLLPRVVAAFREYLAATDEAIAAVRQTAQKEEAAGPRHATAAGGAEAPYSGYFDAQLFAQLAPEFPPRELLKDLGKLACVYPLSRELIAKLCDKLLPPTDARSTRGNKAIKKWFVEVYSLDSLDLRVADGFECNGCGKSVKLYSLRMRCLECDDFDLCEECLRQCRTYDEHTPNHLYFLHYPSCEPLKDMDWTLGELQVLLEAVGKYGFGNWGEIAEWVAQVTPLDQPVKSREQCKAKYFRFGELCNGRTGLPLTNLLYAMSAAAVETCEAERNKATLSAPPIDYTPHINEEGIDIIRSSTYRLAQRAGTQTCLAAPVVEFDYNVDPEEFELPEPRTPVLHVNTQPPRMAGERVLVSGYMHHRGDLEVEWKNSAEFNICDLCVLPTDTPLEKQNKLLACEAYNCVLDERWLRKKIYIERRLWEPKPGKSGLAELEDMMSNLKFVWRYVHARCVRQEVPLFYHPRKATAPARAAADLSEQDLDRVPALFLNERTLQAKLNLLTSWHEAGLRTVEDLQRHGAQVAEQLSKAWPMTPPLTLQATKSENLLLWLKARLQLGEYEFAAFSDELKQRIAGDESFTLEVEQTPEEKAEEEL